MAHSKIVDVRRAALIVIDVQEAFRQVIPDFSAIAGRLSLAARGFQILELPVVVTEQYPKGLGRTAREIASDLPEDFDFFEKTAFSSCGAVSFLEKLRSTGAEQIVVGGLEAHICVNQTVHDLLDNGFEVHLLHDCVGSRRTIDRETGLAKMHAAGAVPACVEMTLFELLRDARHEKFKAIQKLIK